MGTFECPLLTDAFQAGGMPGFGGPGCGRGGAGANFGRSKELCLLTAFWRSARRAARGPRFSGSSGLAFLPPGDINPVIRTSISSENWHILSK